MASVRETALCALQDTLEQIRGRTVAPRNSEIPEQPPAGGLLILRDGEPGEPEIDLSPPYYYYEHVAEVDVVVQKGKAKDRDKVLDEVLVDIDAAIALDRTLGGTVDYATTGAPAETEDIAIEGAANMKGAVIPITLFYSTTNPLS